MSLTIKTLCVTAETPAEIRKADRAVQSLAGTSRRQTLGLFDQSCVWLNGQLCTAPWQRLSNGDTVEIRYDPRQRYAPNKKPPKHLGFEILFEDEHIIVVDKPARYLTVPTQKRERNTLVQRIAGYLSRANRGRPSRVYAVHRLDRGVSGVLVFAKTIEAQRPLRRQFELHQPDRQYVAIVAGQLARSHGTFHSLLATNKSLKRYSTSDPTLGEKAITHYTVEQSFDDATLVRVRLETGRRNQIRVHFAEAGHPILGDQRYEHQRAKHRFWESNRLALHASLLTFNHPLTGQRCHYELPLPAEFGRFIARASS